MKIIMTISFVDYTCLKIVKHKFLKTQPIHSSLDTKKIINSLRTLLFVILKYLEIIIYCSNRIIYVMFQALLRPGRFDRHILIDLPTLVERRQIFETHLKGIKLEQEPQEYSNRMAYLTPGFSGKSFLLILNHVIRYANMFFNYIKHTFIQSFHGQAYWLNHWQQHLVTHLFSRY